MTRFLSVLRSGLLLSLLALLLSACAQLPEPPVAQHLLLPAEQRAQVLASVQRWTASGVASLHRQQGGQSFGFRWQQAPRAQQLRILGPLGNTVAELRESNQQATLLEANGQRRSAPDMGSLLYQVLGVELPVQELPSWLLGIPPAKQVLAYDSAGLPARAQWGDWQLHYLHYSAVGGLQMPALLQADGPNGLQLRIAISDWRLGQ